MVMQSGEIGVVGLGVLRGRQQHNHSREHIRIPMRCL